MILPWPSWGRPPSSEISAPPANIWLTISVKQRTATITRDLFMADPPSTRKFADDGNTTPQNDISVRKRRQNRERNTEKRLTRPTCLEMSKNSSEAHAA